MIKSTMLRVCSGAKWLAAMLLIAMPAVGAEFFLIPSEYEALNRPSPDLMAANPFFVLEGEKINGVRLSIDDSGVDRKCSSEDRSGDGKTCGEPIPIEPGAHILSITLCTRPDCMISGKIWHNEVRFSAGLRERVTIDLAKLATDENESKAVSRIKLGDKPKSACAEAIEQTFYCDTCTADGFRALKDKLVVMQGTCQNAWSKDTDLLFELALWQAAHQDSRRCYKASELKKLPAFLVSWGVEDGFWPPGTIKNGASSWQWGREIVNGSLFGKYQGEALRERALATVDQWYERQVVVDQLIRAVLDPGKNLEPLIEAAADSKWDLNPTTPAGHRAFALSKLAGLSPRFRDNPKLKTLLAHGGAEEAKVHCAYLPEVSTLMQSYLSDNEISQDEWKAVVGFMRRTPPEGSLQKCAGAFWEGRKSPVSLEERLIALGDADCAANRADKVRGKTLSDILRTDASAVPKPLRLKMMHKFADCVTF